MSFGGGGQQTTTSEFKPPAYTTDPSQYSSWQSYLNNAGKIAQTPYQQSGLAQVAPINDYQNTAMQLAYGNALYGNPLSNSAGAAAMNAAQGNYANPWAQNVSGIASGQAYNPWSEGVYGMTQQSNPYMGNAYTEKMVSNIADKMAKAYSEGGAAQNDAAAAMAGAYGGGGWQAMKERGEAGLAQNIGQMATQVYQQQQNTDAGLWNQQYQNMLAALGMGSGQYNQDVANQLNANAQGGGFWSGDIANILAGASLGYQGANNYRQDLTGLMGAGNTWNGYYQKLLDQYNNQWNTENQYDANMNEYLGSALGRASGSYGTTAQTQPGPSTLSGLLGLGMAGAGLYGLYK